MSFATTVTVSEAGGGSCRLSLSSPVLQRVRCDIDFPTYESRVRRWAQSGHDAADDPSRLLTLCMVRPCVARGFSELAVAVLHQCIRPLVRRVPRAIMDISAPESSLADRPHWAIRVTRVLGRRGDRTSISFHTLADLGGKRGSVQIALAWAAKVASKPRPWARTLQAMRASLLARAIASTL